MHLIATLNLSLLQGGTMKKELFITSTQMVQVEEQQNIPTAIYYGKDGSVYIGSKALSNAVEHRLVNEEFKIDL